jgi:choline dehydrogenase
MFQNATFRTWANQAWQANKTGPNSIATGNAAAWLPFPVISKRSSTIASSLEAQDHAAYLAPGTDASVAAGYKAQMGSYAAALRANGTAFYNSAIMSGTNSGILVDLHPLSRGTVNIDPAAPNAEPRVDYRALSNPLDGLIMADIIRYNRFFYTQNPATKQFGGVEVSPGAAVQSDDDFRDYLSRTLSPTEYHPVGTCAMLPRELGGVVDEQLRVYGTKNLRVVDGSIMPTLPGGNTCQTVYAVAEKVSRLGSGLCCEYPFVSEISHPPLVAPVLLTREMQAADIIKAGVKAGA